MAAYVVGNVEITDPAGYEEYRKGGPATCAADGGRYLTRAGAMGVLEGDWVPKRFVFLEFPDLARAKAWHDSPEYRPLREIRARTAKSSLFVVEGL